MSARPNILFILADDMGYGDCICYRQKTRATPHLDTLATEGFREPPPADARHQTGVFA